MGISFKNVSYYYDNFNTKKQDAISNISLDIKKDGEFIFVVGKTGSGKTTLLQHMNCLLLPKEGKLDLFGKCIVKNNKKKVRLTDIRKEVGFVFQFPEYQLFADNSLNDIMFALLNFGYKKDEAKKKTYEIAKKLNIDDTLLSKMPLFLSGGQKRLICIAGILVYDPSILILDEPTRGLDIKNKEDILNIFLDIHNETNKSIIVISHDMNDVYKYAKRVILMDDGKIVYDGNKYDLFKEVDYNKYNLDLPECLKIKNYLENTLDIKLDDSIDDIESLYKSIKENII